MPRSDTGETVQNYNRPKVKEAQVSATWVLPLPSVTTVSAAGCLLEGPDVSIQYSSPNRRQ